MPPNISSTGSVVELSTQPGASLDKEIDRRRLDIVWKNVLYMSYFHIAAVYGIYLWISGQVQWTTVAFSLITCVAGMLGITAGAHRLWSHKCYKATLPLRILLCIMQTMASQNSIHEWCRDHRVHHKYTETNADPHNVKRGFFFAHVGWLLVRKHEDVKMKGKSIFMTDLESDPVVMFQKRHFVLLTLLLCFIVPWLLPIYCFGEKPWNSWNSAMARYILSLNITWLVNSAAHLWGHKPYDKNINPVENKSVAILAIGEGWHNYHHTFPWDYKAAELSLYKYNWTTAFIDFFAWIGWAYDLKTVPEKIVRQRVFRTGDGSHPEYENDKTAQTYEKIGSDHKTEVMHAWGWGDEDVSQENINVTVTL